MPLSRLKSIGFSDNEVKTYEFLLANGDCTREQIEKGAKLKKGEADAPIQSLRVGMDSPPPTAMAIASSTAMLW